MADATNKTTLNITGMHCASCVNRIEKALSSLNGVNSVTVNLLTNKAFVAGNVTVDTLYKVVEKLGFGVEKQNTVIDKNLFNDIGVNDGKPIISKTDGKSVKTDKDPGSEETQKNRFICSAILTCPIFFISMFSIHSSFFLLLQFLLSTVVVFTVGFGFIKAAISQIRHLALGMDTLIAIGAGSAYFYSVLNMITLSHNNLYFETSAMIITLILFGRYLESKAKSKAGEAIRKLVELRPANARVIRDGSEIEIPINQIVVGDEIIIRPGEKMPVDGVVMYGQTTANESMLTGESLPVDKKEDDDIFSGTINNNGTIKIKAKKVGSETVIAQIIKTVEEAQSTKAHIQRIADKVAGIFVPFVIGIALLTLFVWLIFGNQFNNSLTSAISVLVIACPCAMGLAVPTAIIVSSGRAAKEGILVKNASGLEYAFKIDLLVFDKTGTITEGKPKVTGIHNLGDYTDSEILKIAGSCEKYSEHPYGKAVFRYIQENGVKLVDVKNFQAMPGMGINAEFDGKAVHLGNKLLMRENNIEIIPFESKVNDLKKDGNTVFYLAVSGTIKALIAIADVIRESSKPAIKQIKSMGIIPVMLTGDDDEIARLIANKAGITHFNSKLKPEDKINEVQLYKSKGYFVGMVGDGINDAPALAASDVSFAIGSGSDIAMETADIVLVQGDAAKVVKTIELSKQTMKIIKQNLFWAFGYNIIALPIAAFGMLNPMIAAGAMALSSVSVVVNSLRLRK